MNTAQKVTSPLAGWLSKTISTTPNGRYFNVIRVSNEPRLEVIAQVTGTKKGSIASAARSSITHSVSLALWRLRNSTSRFNASVTNCPVLSPGVLAASTALITSCGTLAATVCDFAFTALVAICEPSSTNKTEYARKKISVQHLTCSTPALKLVFNTLSTGKAQEVKKTTPRCGGTLPRRLTTTVNASNEAAMKEHITPPQGRHSYTWRFIALSVMGSKVIHITATNEHEAREKSPAGHIMIFAARIRIGGIQ